MLKEYNIKDTLIIESQSIQLIHTFDLIGTNIGNCKAGFFYNDSCQINFKQRCRNWIYNLNPFIDSNNNYSKIILLNKSNGDTISKFPFIACSNIIIDKKNCLIIGFSLDFVSPVNLVVSNFKGQIIYQTFFSILEIKPDDKQFEAFRSIIQGQFNDDIVVSLTQIELPNSKKTGYKIQFAYNEEVIRKKIIQQNPNSTEDVINLKIKEYKENFNKNLQLSYLLDVSNDNALKVYIKGFYGNMFSYIERSFNPLLMKETGPYSFLILYHEICEQTSKVNSKDKYSVSCQQRDYGFALQKQAEFLGVDYTYNLKSSESGDFDDLNGYQIISVVSYTKNVNKKGIVTSYTKKQ